MRATGTPMIAPQLASVSESLRIIQMTVPLWAPKAIRMRSEEHTSELQSPDHLVCRLLLEKKKNKECAQHTLEERHHQFPSPREQSIPSRPQGCNKPSHIIVLFSVG